MLRAETAQSSEGLRSVFSSIGNAFLLKVHSGNPTSLIGLCQEGKSSPDALGRSAGVNISGSSARRVGLSAGFLFENRTRHVMINCDFEVFRCPYSSQLRSLLSRLSDEEGLEPRVASTIFSTGVSWPGACLCCCSPHFGDGTMTTDGIRPVALIYPLRLSICLSA